MRGTGGHLLFTLTTIWQIKGDVHILGVSSPPPYQQGQLYVLPRQGTGAALTSNSSYERQGQLSLSLVAKGDGEEGSMTLTLPWIISFSEYCYFVIFQLIEE